MAEITLGGNPIHTAGEIPQKGDPAPEFKLTNTELKDRHLSDFEGKKVVLNIFPSVDTDVCAASVREFNKRVSEREDATVLNISKDLPFAHKRFCAAEGLESVETLSEYKDQNFSRAYKATITDGPFDGLLSRAVVVIDEDAQVLYSEQVPEIGQEPDYEAAIQALEQ